MMRLPTFWRRNFLAAECGLAMIVTIGVAAYFLSFGPDGGITQVVDGERAEIYRTTASVAAALLGFLIAAVSVMLGFAQSERLAVLRKSRHYPTLFAIFFSTIRSLALLALASFIGLLFDADGSPQLWLEMIFLFLAALSVLRIARVIWVLEKVIVIVAGATARRNDRYTRNTFIASSPR